VLKEIVGVESKEEVLDKIANMLKFVKNQDYVAHFLDVSFNILKRLFSLFMAFLNRIMEEFSANK
jgi:tRNA(Phe) wybutosine-synthesizing methylase Tyw3